MSERFDRLRKYREDELKKKQEEEEELRKQKGKVAEELPSPKKPFDEKPPPPPPSSLSHSVNMFSNPLETFLRKQTLPKREPPLVSTFSGGTSVIEPLDFDSSSQSSKEDNEREKEVKQEPPVSSPGIMVANLVPEVQMMMNQMEKPSLLSEKFQKIQNSLIRKMKASYHPYVPVQIFTPHIDHPIEVIALVDIGASTSLLDFRTLFYSLLSAPRSSFRPLDFFSPRTTADDTNRPFGPMPIS